MRKVWIFLLGICLLHYGFSKSNVGSAEIAYIHMEWEEEGEDGLSLRRNLARWYNLNLFSEDPDPDFFHGCKTILSYGEMMGYIEFPDQKRNVPIYNSDRFDGFVHDSGTLLPIGQRGSNVVLTSSEQIRLEEGEKVIVWILGKPLTYVNGGEGSDYCTLICQGNAYICGRLWENQGIPMDISNKKY